MQKLKLFIGVLIIFCYVAPFSSCSNFGPTKTIVIDSAGRATEIKYEPKFAISNIYDLKSNSKSTWDKIINQAVFPTNNSISGIGEILNARNSLGSFSLAISLIISLVMLRPIKILKLRRWALSLTITGMATVSIYGIYTLLIYKHNLLWGFWVLILLFLSKLVIEIKTHK